jgi:hypothetical protein
MSLFPGRDFQNVHCKKSVGTPVSYFAGKETGEGNILANGKKKM